MPKAAGLAEILLRQYKNQIASFELIPSEGGVFEVKRNGELIFSKKELGRFPEKIEITSRLNI